MKNIPQAYSQEFSKLIGIPYDELDCYRLVAAFFKRVFKLDFVVYDYVTEDITKEEIAEYVNTGLFSEQFSKVKKPEFGDIVIANFFGYPVHIAVYVGSNKIFHTMKGKNSCVENMDFKWQKRIEGFYRWQKFNQIH